MVVLSASICTKSGKALISRQFVEMTRIRIEGLLAAFPKLINTDSKQQHTYIETESIRYVYLPMEGFYILLITNKASNIVEDLETIKLISKLIPVITQTTNNLTEEKVIEKSFELIFGFDEVITTGGYREPINLQQIRTNLEMESHEEKLVFMIKQSKMDEAVKQQKVAIQAMKEKAKENARLGGFGSGGSSGYGNDISNSYNESSAFSSPAVTPVVTPMVPTTTSSSRQPAVKGMSLGGAKNKNVEDALMKEDNLAPVLKPTKSSGSSSSAVEAPIVVNAVQHPIMMVIAEKVSANITRDGSLELFEIKGNLTLTAATDEAALCSVQLKQFNMEGFQFTTHPKINKALFEKNYSLQLKDATKGFPSVRPVGILKWNYSSTTSDDLVPIKINCWPEEEGRGKMLVTIEYSMDIADQELHDVKIRIPLGTHEAPTIVNVDGSHKHNAQANELVWSIDMIDKSNSSGNLEFHIQQRDADAFFPISVQFSSQKLYCNVEVATVKSVTSNTPIMYGITSGMSTEEYVIV